MHASDEVHRDAADDEVPCVVAHERTPALRWHAVAWRSIEVRGHVLADRARRDPQAQLEPQFIGDAPLTPREVGARHLPDEDLQLHWDRRPSRGRCAVPEQSKPLAPPPVERCRLHHHQSRLGVEPLRQPDQDETSGVAGASWLDIMLLIEGELLTEEEILALPELP